MHSHRWYDQTSKLKSNSSNYCKEKYHNYIKNYKGLPNIQNRSHGCTKGILEVFVPYPVTNMAVSFSAFFILSTIHLFSFKFNRCWKIQYRRVVNREGKNKNNNNMKEEDRSQVWTIQPLKYIYILKKGHTKLNDWWRVNRPLQLNFLFFLQTLSLYFLILQSPKWNS